VTSSAPVSLCDPDLDHGIQLRVEKDPRVVAQKVADSAAVPEVVQSVQLLPQLLGEDFDWRASKVLVLADAHE